MLGSWFDACTTTLHQVVLVSLLLLFLGEGSCMCKTGKQRGISRSNARISDFEISSVNKTNIQHEVNDKGINEHPEIMHDNAFDEMGIKQGMIGNNIGKGIRESSKGFQTNIFAKRDIQQAISVREGIIKSAIFPKIMAENRRHTIKDTLFRSRRVTSSSSSDGFNFTWPIKHVAEIEGDIILGGLMMVHEREDRRICGPIMPQGGIQALECMLYTMDWINTQKDFLPGIKLGAYILDDCDKDTYGLEQAVDFIKGKQNN